MVAALLVILGLVCLVSLSLAAPSQAAEGTTATPNVNDNLATAQRSADEAKSLYWAAQAQTNFDNGDPFTAYALAIQANGLSNPPTQAQRALNNIAYQPGPRRIIGEHLKNAVFTASWRYMFSISDYDEVTMWDTATGEVMRHFDGPDEYVNNIVLSPDERSLLSVGWEGQMLIWDVETGKEIHRIAGNGFSNLAEAQSLFSPDSSKVVTFDNGPVSLYDVLSGRELLRLTEGVPQFSPDGKLLMLNAYSGNERIAIWDIATGQKIYSLNIGQQPIGRVNGATFSPDGKQVISYGDKLILWNVKTGKKVDELSGHDPNLPIHNAVFSPDGKLLVSSDEAGGVIIWNIDDQTEANRLNGFDTGVDVTFSSDGRKMLTESAHYISYCVDCPTTISQSPNPKLLLWDIQSLSIIQDYSRRRYNLNRGEFENITIDRSWLRPDGKQIATLSEGRVTLWDTENGQMLHDFSGQNVDLNAYGFDQSRNGTIFSPDRKYGLKISNPSYDVGKGVMSLYDLATNKSLVSFKGHNYPIDSAAFSPDGRYIVSGADNGEMILWDAKTGQAIRSFGDQNGEEKFKDIDGIDVKFSPDGRSVVSAAGSSYSGKPELILWDVATGQEIRRFIGHSQAVRLYSVAFSPDGRIMASAGSDDTLDSQYRTQPHPELILWDVATGQEIRRFIGHQGDIYSVAFSPDGQHILSYADVYGRGTELYLWDIASGAIVNRYPTGNQAIRHISFSDDGHSILSIGEVGSKDKLIMWRADSIAETIQWLLGNRVVPALTCEQRTYYHVDPLCVGGALPALTPFPTAGPSPTTNLTLTTATLTASVTPTIPTVTPSLTPTIPTATPTPTHTSTSNPATLDAQRNATNQAVARDLAPTQTERAVVWLTATAVTYTPSPTFNPNSEALAGSQRDTLVPPKWKVWRYQGTAGEVVTIRITADPLAKGADPSTALRDTLFDLRGPNGLLLELVNDYDPNHPADSLLSNYHLPATGIYEIEIHSVGFNTGAYTLTIQSSKSASSPIITLTPSATASATATATPTATATLNLATQTAQAAATATR